MENKNTSKSFAEIAGQLIGSIIVWFLTAGFIYWGWNILAPHLNAPTFTYWEIFFLRMAFSSIITLVFRKN